MGGNFLQENNSYIFFRVFIFCLIFTAVRLTFIYVADLPLWLNEAEFWIYSKDLSFGYITDPPFIAFITNGFTDFCGNSRFCIRMPSVIFHLFTSIFIFFAARSLYNSLVGYFSALTYITLPAVSLSSVFLSPDSFMLTFWAFAFYMFVKIYKNPNYTGIIEWVLISIAVGLGIMSKYLMLWFVVCMILYFLFFNFLRLFSIGFLFFLALITAIAIPHILWNSDNDYISIYVALKDSFGFDFSSNSTESPKLDANNIMEFVGGQIAVLGPLLFFLIMGSFFMNIEKFSSMKKEQEIQSHKRLLLTFSIPILIFGIVSSLLAEAEPQIIAPAYIALVIYFSRIFLISGKKFWINTSIITNTLILMLMLNIKTLSDSVDFIKDPLERLKVWNQTTNTVEQLLEAFPGYKVAADEKKIIAPLSYNLRTRNGAPYEIIKWNDTDEVQDYFDMTQGKIEANEKNRIIFITRTKEPEYFRKYYKKVNRIKDSRLPKNFNVYMLQGYKGR